MYADWGYWQLYHNVTFDGIKKQIIVNPGVTSLSVKKDIYSDWKEWVKLHDNLKYLQAIRTIGGDSVGGGQYAGDMYFLMNGWQVVISANTKITGILYHDDGIDPYLILPGGGVTATVSSLAYAYNTTGGSSGATPAEVWAYANRTLTTSPPTAADIRVEMDTNSKLASVKTKVDSLVNGPSAATIASQVRTELTADLAHLNSLTNGPSAATIAAQVRTELTPELTHLLVLQNNQGLSPTQATMILEMYELLGLNPTKPLIVTETTRHAGTINQTIATTPTQTTVTRV